MGLAHNCNYPERLERLEEIVYVYRELNAYLFLSF